MHMENQIVIFAPVEHVYGLGANITRWPEHLAHYRYVNVSFDDGRVRQASMGALRGSFPVRWRTSQVLLPEENRILFFHTGGITRGMYVEWNLTEIAPADGGGVRVVISHELAYPLPAITQWFARDIVGSLFVSHIAGRTLARIKQIAESQPLERP